MCGRDRKRDTDARDRAREGMKRESGTNKGNSIVPAWGLRALGKPGTSPDMQELGMILVVPSS